MHKDQGFGESLSRRDLSRGEGLVLIRWLRDGDGRGFAAVQRQKGFDVGDRG